MGTQMDAVPVLAALAPPLVAAVAFVLILRSVLRSDRSVAEAPPDSDDPPRDEGPG